MKCWSYDTIRDVDFQRLRKAHIVFEKENQLKSICKAHLKQHSYQSAQYQQ